MYKSLLASMLFLINFMANSQEKAIYDANVEKRTVGSFEAIKVSDGINLYITQSEEEGVAVSATEIAHRDKIKTVVENGELKIYLEQGWNWKNKKLTAYVAVKSLKKLRASGGADIFIKGELKSDKLNMVLTGGSDFTGQLSVTDLIIDQSGGSDVRLKGNAVNVKVSASGGSDFKGFELTADYAIVQASGGSDAEVTVTKEMAAEASGGSDVNYKGSPVIKYKSASGGGSVSKRG
jgi:ribosomal protein S6E (S10)